MEGFMYASTSFGIFSLAYPQEDVLPDGLTHLGYKPSLV